MVQRRLGHTSIVTTLDIYASVLPSQQQDAAAKLAALAPPLKKFTGGPCLTGPRSERTIHPPQKGGNLPAAQMRPVPKALGTVAAKPRNR